MDCGERNPRWRSFAGKTCDPTVDPCWRPERHHSIVILTHEPLLYFLPLPSEGGKG